MKLISALLLFAFFSVYQLSSQTVNIPDLNFKNKLIQLGVDLNKDNEIQQEEALKVDSISLLSNSITSLVGIEEFKNLKYFSTQMNSIGYVDFSKNTLLEYLDCSYTNISTLDISKNTKLKTLICSFNFQLQSIDLSLNTELERLSMMYNQFKSINLNNNLLLRQLEIRYISLNEIDLTQNINLERLIISNSNLTNLDVSLNSKLTYLNCQYNNNLAIICINNNHVNLIPYNHSNWTKDSETNWSTSCSNGISEIEALPINLKIVKVINYMGDEVSIDNLESGIYIILYSDGTNCKILINK